MHDDITLPPISDLTPTIFGDIVRLEITYTQNGGMTYTTEEFVLCSLGRLRYAISLDTGAEYTRPQLIAKYSNVQAQFRVAKTRVQAYPQYK